MINLFYIEWLKVSKSRYFKWMMGLWLLAFISVPILLGETLEWASDNFNGLDELLPMAAEDFPIFSPHDVWQNLAFVYKYISVFLCIIVIVNVGQEWEEKTIRQNVIDGMSRGQYFLSKTVMLLILSVLSTFGVFLLGFILGSTSDSEVGVMESFDFLLAYFLHVFLFISIAMLFINLFRKVGVTILVFLVYSFFVESIGAGILNAIFGKMGSVNVGSILPVEASWDLIPFPFKRYFMIYTPDYVNMGSVLMALAWTVIILFFNYLLTTRRDLR